jgi:hypothetical protein
VAAALTDIQKRRLAERGYRWVQTIRRLNTVAEAISDDEAPEKHAETIDGLHMLSLALEHLDACVRVLDEAGEVLAGSGKFRTAWGAVSDLRDGLEHEEEYIAGRGRFARLFSPSWVADGYFESNLFIWGPEGIDAVGFMGQDYDVRPAIVTALDLEAPLLALWNPPIGTEAYVWSEPIDSGD